MLALSVDDLRLFLHVTAATVWVGGQLVLGALVPALRHVSPEAPRAAAVAFGRIGWPAFAVLLATGAWNISAESSKNHGDWMATLNLKMAVVIVSGVAAYLHTKAATAKSRGLWGALTGLSALVAVLLGVQLAG